MIHIVTGNVHNSNCTIIGGYVDQLKGKYPEAELADAKFPFEGNKKYGKISYAYTAEKSKVIVNLYGNRTHDLKKSLEKLMEIVFVLKQTNFSVKIGLPYEIFNSSEEVNGIIRELSKEYEQEIYVYRLPEGCEK